MSNLDLGRRHDLPRLEEAGPRICLTEGCDTVLSRFNSAQRCAVCANRVEIGGAVIHRDPPVIVAPRPPPPERPVLEGAVPLPGVVRPKRERTYAEMTAKTTPIHEPEETPREDTSSDEIQEPAAPPEPEPEPEPTRGKPCRILDCNEQAKHNVGSRGVYGSLCDTHYQQRREQAGARAQARAKPTRAPKIPSAAPPEPLGRAGILARLTQLGTELDAIDAQRWVLNDQASRILEEWGDLLRALARYDGDAR